MMTIFFRNARAANLIVGREQFATVSSFQGKLICTRREQPLDVERIMQC